tara:strand:+ start:3539 stop:3754 length:216 start_codon:yes stop_codon:yes gene_type:complete
VDNKKSRIRHVAKTITWRIIASGTTLALTLIFAVPMKTATTIVLVGFFLKMLFYYLHERAWFKYGRLGRDD